MSALDFLLTAAAVLYLAEVISSKDGPFGVLASLRARLPLGGLTACMWCLAPWLALVLLALYPALPQLVWVFGIAGLALMLRSYTGVHHG